MIRVAVDIQSILELLPVPMFKFQVLNAQTGLLDLKACPLNSISMERNDSAYDSNNAQLCSNAVLLVMLSSCYSFPLDLIINPCLRILELIIKIILQTNSIKL